MSKIALFVACLALVLVTGQGLPLKNMMLKKKMMMGALLHRTPSPVPVPSSPMDPPPMSPSPPLPPKTPSLTPSPMIPESRVPTIVTYETTVYPKATGEVTVYPKLTGETTVYAKVTGEMMDDGMAHEYTVHDEDMMMHEDNTYTYVDHTMAASVGASMVHTTSAPVEYYTVYTEEP